MSIKIERDIKLLEGKDARLIIPNINNKGNASLCFRYIKEYLKLVQIIIVL